MSIQNAIAIYGGRGTWDLRNIRAYFEEYGVKTAEDREQLEAVNVLLNNR